MTLSASQPAALEPLHDRVGDLVGQPSLWLIKGGLQKQPGHCRVTRDATTFRFLPELPDEMRMNPKCQGDELPRSPRDLEKHVASPELTQDLLARHIFDPLRHMSLTPYRSSHAVTGRSRSGPTRSTTTSSGRPPSVRPRKRNRLAYLPPFLHLGWRTHWKSPWVINSSTSQGGTPCLETCSSFASSHSTKGSSPQGIIPIAVMYYFCHTAITMSSPAFSHAVLDLATEEHR